MTRFLSQILTWNFACMIKQMESSGLIPPQFHFKIAHREGLLSNANIGDYVEAALIDKMALNYETFGKLPKVLKFGCTTLHRIKGDRCK